MSLDREHRRVVVQLTQGFYLHRDVLYLSTESSVTQIAALKATFAPNLAAAPQAGSDDSSLSAREAIIPVVNGPRGVNNPQRQGLQSAVAGKGDPLNIIREEPECSDPRDPKNCSALHYSPLLDAHPFAWTQTAINNGQRVRIISHQDVESLFNAGEVVNAAPDGPVNHDPEINGPRAAGVVVKYPPIFVATSYRGSGRIGAGRVILPAPFPLMAISQSWSIDLGGEVNLETCCSWPGCSKMPAVSRRTASSGSSGTPGRDSTSRIPEYRS